MQDRSDEILKKTGLFLAMDKEKAKKGGLTEIINYAIKEYLFEDSRRNTMRGGQIRG